MALTKRRASDDDFDDAVDLVYFEVTEYDDCDSDIDSYCWGSPDDITSTSGSESFQPLDDEEQALDDHTSALWPPLEDVAPCEQSPRSSRDSRDSVCSVDLMSDLEESAAAMLALTLTADLSVAAKEGARLCERDASRRVAVDHLSINQVLSRRAVAADLLTQGVGHTAGCGVPLPVLPIAVAQLILEDALPLEACFASFANATGVQLHSALSVSLLDLSACALSSDAAGVVGWLLRHNQMLQHLDVSDNPLNAAGALLITSTMPCARQLRFLALNNVALCSAGGTDPSALSALAHALSNSTRLAELQLRSNSIGASGLSGVRELSTALSKPDCPLSTLDLRVNALQPAGAASLAVALLQNQRLEQLFLGSNQLTGTFGKSREGVRALAVAVSFNCRLRVLDLSCNAIGCRNSESMEMWHNMPTCSMHLVHALEQNSVLRQLDLRGNHLVGCQGEALCHAWKRHPRDTTLAL